MLTKILILNVLFGFGFGSELFAFQDCGGSKLRFDNIYVSPLPIKLSQTQKITVSAKVQILEDLPIDALAELKLIKLWDTGDKVIELEIPCVDDMGSCTIKVCDIFSKWYNDVICPFFKKANVQCKCPVHKGVFEAKDIAVEVPFAKIKGMIAQLASGDYKIQFRITDANKKANYSCLKLQAHLVIDK